MSNTKIVTVSVLLPVSLRVEAGLNDQGHGRILRLVDDVVHVSLPVLQDAMDPEDYDDLDCDLRRNNVSDDNDDDEPKRSDRPFPTLSELHESEDPEIDDRGSYRVSLETLSDGLDEYGIFGYDKAYRIRDKLGATGRWTISATCFVNRVLLEE